MSFTRALAAMFLAAPPKKRKGKDMNPDKVEEKVTIGRFYVGPYSVSIEGVRFAQSKAPAHSYHEYMVYNRALKVEDGQRKIVQTPLLKSPVFRCPNYEEVRHLLKSNGYTL